MNAVARESASRAYIQQTLERMKAIANGEVPVRKAGEIKKKVVKKTTPKKAVGARASTQKRSPADTKKQTVTKKTTK